jgi:peptidoglycan/xylan/chitin deacetylase (PgdA/CDA1 family)
VPLQSCLTTTLGDALAPLVPLGAARLLHGDAPLAVFYHVVCEQRLPHLAHLYSFHTPEAFEKQIRFLQSRFDFVSEDDLLARASTGASLPVRAAHLSFDDGLSQCFSVVRPILLKLGVPCSFFACSDYVDNRRVFHRHIVSLCLDSLDALDRRAAIEPLLARASEIAGSPLRSKDELSLWLRGRDRDSEADLRALAPALEVDVDSLTTTIEPFMSSAELLALQREGFSIGAHGRSHSDLRRMSHVEVRDEIVLASRSIAALLGRNAVAFAFPYSGEGISRDVLAQIVRDAEEVSFLFDSDWPARDAGFIVQRLCAETSAPPHAESVPIARVAKRAMLRAARRRVAAPR